MGFAVLNVVSAVFVQQVGTLGRLDLTESVGHGLDSVEEPEANMNIR